MNDTHPASYLTLLVAHKWWIGGMTLLAAAAAAVFSLTLEDQYRASARLLVLEPTVESKLSGHQNVNSAVYTVDTYSSMLTNQKLLAGVVRNLGLDFPPDRLTPGKLRGLLSIVPVKDTKLIEVGIVYSNPVRAKKISNKVAEEFLNLYEHLRTNEINTSQSFVWDQLDRVNADFVRVQDSLQTARTMGRIEELQTRLQHILEQTKMFRTDLETSKGDLSRINANLAELSQLLDGLPNETVASNRRIRTVLTGGVPDETPGRAGEIAQSLQEIDLASMSRLTSNEEQKTLLDKATITLETLQSAANDLENPPTKRRLTPQEWSERFRILTAGLAELELTMEELSSSLGREASGLSPMRDRLRSLRLAAQGDVSQETVEEQRQTNPLRMMLARQEAEARITKKGLEAKIDHLEDVVSSLEREITGVEVRLYTGRRNVEALEEESKIIVALKSFLTEKYDQSRIEVAAKLGTMTLVDPALTPEKKIGPQRKLNVLLGLLIGFILSSLLVIGSDFLRQDQLI